MFDCIVIANIEYTVEELLLTADLVSQHCCRRQYVQYDGLKLYYNDFLTSVKLGLIIGPEKMNTKSINLL